MPMLSLVMADVHDVLRLEERPDEPPGPGQLKLEVLAVGICGSDIHGSTGKTGRRAVGGVMGHEIAARVDAVGAGVVGWAPGDLLTVDPVIGCGTCPQCDAGSANRCALVRIIGVAPELPGGFSTSLNIPAEQAIRCMASRRLTALVEPLAVGLNAVRQLPSVAGRTLLVIGGGMIGLACVWAALRDGAKRVYCADVLPDRASRVAALGGIGLDVSTKPLAEVVPAGVIDAVIDAAGSQHTVLAAIALCPPGGQVVLVGMGSPALTLSAYALVTAERSLVGTFCSPRSVFTECVRAVESGEVDADLFIDATTDLVQASAVIHELATGTRQSVKTLIVPGATAEGES